MTCARLAAALAAALVLGACATFEVGTDGLSFPERRARLEAVTAWRLDGVIAVDTGERAFQGSFRWVQEGERLTLDIRARGPLRTRVLSVTGTDDALVVTSRGDRYELTDPEAQLPALLEGGWWIPITSFRSWLLGLPDEQHRVASLERGPDGAITRLAQRLWDVEYPTYQLVASPQGETLVPRTIELAHQDLSLIVTVSQWTPLAPDAAP